MSVFSRGRASAPVVAPDATAEARAEIETAIDAIARRRLIEAVREVDAAVAAVRISKLSAADRATVSDRLLDARNRMVAPSCS